MHDLHNSGPELTRFCAKKLVVTLKSDCLMNYRDVDGQAGLYKSPLENLCGDISYQIAQRRSKLKVLNLDQQVPHWCTMESKINAVVTNVLTDDVTSYYPCFNSVLEPEDSLCTHPATLNRRWCRPYVSQWGLHEKRYVETYLLHEPSSTTSETMTGMELGFKFREFSPVNSSDNQGTHFGDLLRVELVTDETKCHDDEKTAARHSHCCGHNYTCH